MGRKDTEGMQGFCDKQPGANQIVGGYTTTRNLAITNISIHLEFDIDNWMAGRSANRMDWNIPCPDLRDAA